MPELRLFNRFSTGEKELLGLIQKHTQLAIEAAETLRTFVGQILADEWEEARQTYARIDELESSADDLHKKTVERLSSGVFFAGIGVDLINLTENIDGIADSAKDAARVLIYRRLEVPKLFPVRKLLEDYIEVCIKAAHSIRRAVEGIGVSKAEVLSSTRETEQYEEAADEVKDELIERLYALDLSVLSTIQLKDFVLIADNIGDYAEDAGDVMYILMSKGYA